MERGDVFHRVSAKAPPDVVDITDLNGDVGSDGPSNQGLLQILDYADVVRRVTKAGPPQWLIEGLWPADAYGVLGAEDKAGKTWAVLDLAVSVVATAPWFGRFIPHCAGPVLLFLGEGGERATHRRLDAIRRSIGAEPGDLDGLRLCFAAPRLTEPSHLEAVRRELEQHPPVLVCLDPLYLAAAGAKGSDLYAMGDVLYRIQALCQAADAALVVSTHWNKTGHGSGPQRFTGAGPAAWGRVLGSAAVERRASEPNGTSNVLLRWEFMGSEIPESTFRVRRRVWEETRGDLASPLVYEVEVTSEGTAVGNPLAPSRYRVLSALQEGGPRLSVSQIGDGVADDGQGNPLRRRTIQEALKDLEGVGLAEGTEPIAGLERLWSARE